MGVEIARSGGEGEAGEIGEAVGVGGAGGGERRGTGGARAVTGSPLIKAETGESSQSSADVNSAPLFSATK